MKREIARVMVFSIIVATLLLASCGPKTTSTTTPQTTTTSVTSTAPTTSKTPTTSTAPATSATSTLVATTSQPQYGGTLTAASQNDITSGFDPYKGDPLAQWIYASLTTEGLGGGDWAKGPSGTKDWDGVGWLIPTRDITGMLAESWEVSPDGLTYIFHLRKGIRFQNKPPANGREMTSADVKYSWDRRLGIGSGFTKPSPYFSRAALAVLTEVATPDKYTVVFKASAFDYQLLQEILIGYFTDIYPPEVITAYGSMDDWRNVIGTGPFTITDYVKGSQVTMKKNHDYWRNDPLHPSNRLPYVDNYNVLIIPDASVRMTAIRVGKIDLQLYATISFRDKAQLEKTMTYNLVFGDIFVGAGKSMKFNMDRPPFDNLNVRRALYMGLDFNEIASVLGGDTRGQKYGSFLNIASGPDLYTQWDDLPADVKDFLTYQPDKAKQMLAKEGYPNGFTVSVLLSSLDTDAIDIYQILAEQWRRIGVTLKLDIVDSTTFFARDRVQDYQMSTFNPGTASITGTFYLLLTGIYKPRWDDPYPVAEYTRILGIKDESQRSKAMKALNIHLLRNVFLITPRVRPASYTMAQPWVGGYHGEYMMRWNDFGSIMPYLWIDAAKKAALLK